VPVGPSLKEIIVKVPAADPPNTKYGYSTFNTTVLVWIVEKVTGKPWNQVVSDRIWKKAGMGNDALVALSPSSEMLGSGIFAGTLRDFMRYGLLYTPSWKKVAKERVVP
jgi:CubicO group peptidase (beta-lactamase class C family)